MNDEKPSEPSKKPSKTSSNVIAIPQPLTAQSGIKLFGTHAQQVAAAEKLTGVKWGEDDTYEDWVKAIEAKTGKKTIVIGSTYPKLPSGSNAFDARMTIPAFDKAIDHYAKAFGIPYPGYEDHWEWVNQLKAKAEKLRLTGIESKAKQPVDGKIPKVEPKAPKAEPKAPKVEPKERAPKVEPKERAPKVEPKKWRVPKDVIIVPQSWYGKVTPIFGDNDEQTEALEELTGVKGISNYDAWVKAIEAKTGKKAAVIGSTYPKLPTKSTAAAAGMTRAEFSRSIDHYVKAFGVPYPGEDLHWKWLSELKQVATKLKLTGIEPESMQPIDGKLPRPKKPKERAPKAAPKERAPKAVPDFSSWLTGAMVDKKETPKT
jgi:hypothetical protein